MATSGRSHVDVGITGEALRQLRFGSQISLSYLMKKSLDIVSLGFVGHQGKLYLSAAGLALVTANVTGNSILLGLGGAQSTLCSQANGAGDPDTMNAVFQRSILISLLTCIPISILWMFAEPAFLSLGQEHELAHHAALFMLWLIPGNLFFSLSLCIQNWLFSQQKIAAPAVVISIVAVLHVVWNYLFVIVFNMGYLGTAVAISTSRLMELLMLFGYIKLSGALSDTNFAWSSRCMEQWSPFFVLLSGNVMMMSELWASEVLTFLSGTLANAHVEMAAMSIYQSINAFCFQFSNGIQAIASARVGNFLGGGNAESALTAAKVAASLAFTLTVCVSTALYIFGRYFLLVYTDDEAVVDAALMLIPILALYVIGDGTVAALSGVIKGLGKQKIGGRIVVFSYYAIAIPLSVLLTYHWGGNINFGLGTLGLCLGTLAGTYMHCFLYAMYIFFIINWADEVALTKKRIELNRKSPVGTSSNSQLRSLPSKISNSYGDDDNDDYHEVSRVGRFIANLFTYVPTFGAKSDEEQRQCEYELVQAYTADLEEADVTIERVEDSDDEHYL